MRRTLCAFALGLGLLTGFTLSAAPAQAQQQQALPTLSVQESRLGNGLRVLMHEDHTTPTVCVNVWYHVGSKDEPARRNGFAHLFEHLMFQGSKHVGEDLFFHYLEQAGASDRNGTTNLDRTNYYETLPANQLELALWLESDRMGFLLDHVDQQTFESQRNVVKNERRQNYENAPYGLVDKYIREALFPTSHPYHNLTIGSPEDLDAASLENVREFYRRFYVPNNATLVVAGDIDPVKTRELVEKYFSPIARGAEVPQLHPTPAVGLSRQVTLQIEAGVELPRAIMAYVTPPYFQPGDAALDALGNVLSDGKSSRLYKRLVYDMQIAKDVVAYQASSQLSSTFEIVATAAPGHTAEELVQAIDSELDKIRSEAPSAAEVDRAKASLESSLIFRLEMVGKRADMLNTYAHYTGDPSYFSKDIARYRALTASDIQQAMRTWLPANKRVLAIVRPNPQAPKAGVLKGAS